MVDAITDKKYWEEYWKSFIPFSVNNNHIFKKLFTGLPKAGASFIEIGGFPGMSSIYFNKYLNYDVTLLDYFIDETIIHKMERINDISQGSIKLIKADFLKYQPKMEYDFVCSMGFIEHFSNTETIIEKHVALLKGKGTLFISIPNFRGLNGIWQKLFDIKNYLNHNILCMDVKYLENICTKLKLNNVSVFYYGRPIVWLEKNSANKIIHLFTKIFAKVLRVLPIRNSKVFSPWIIIKATR